MLQFQHLFFNVAVPATFLHHCSFNTFFSTSQNQHLFFNVAVPATYTYCGGNFAFSKREFPVALPRSGVPYTPAHLDKRSPLPLTGCFDFQSRSDISLSQTVLYSVQCTLACAYPRISSHAHCTFRAGLTIRGHPNVRQGPFVIRIDRIFSAGALFSLGVHFSSPQKF